MLVVIFAYVGVIVRVNIGAKLRARERPREIAGAKGLQILDAFANADEMDGQLEFFPQSGENAAARGPVKFRHDEPRHANKPGRGLRANEKLSDDKHGKE